MIKKISENQPISTINTSSVEAAKTVETSKIGSVSNISPTNPQHDIRPIERTTRALTAADRAQIFKLVEEETERMVKSGTIPRTRKKTITGAVKMAIDSAIIEENEDKEKA